MSASVPGLGPFLLPISSIILTELCCVREREPQVWSLKVLPNPYCNPAVDRGHQSVLTLCSALCWYMGEKARQILPCRNLYYIWEEETNGPRKIFLNTNLQLLGASWVVQIVKAKGISKWKKVCYCFTFWHYYSSNSTEPRVQSHHVWEDLKVSVDFKFNMNQQFGEAAKLYQIFNSNSVYIMREEVTLVSPLCCLGHLYVRICVFYVCPRHCSRHGMWQ